MIELLKSKLDLKWITPIYKKHPRIMWELLESKCKHELGPDADKEECVLDWIEDFNKYDPYNNHQRKYGING